MISSDGCGVQPPPREELALRSAYGRNYLQGAPKPISVVTLRKAGDNANGHQNSDFTLGGGPGYNTGGSPVNPQSPQLSFAG